MPDVIIDLVFDLPAQLAFVCFFTKLLPMRHVPVYTILRLLLFPFLVNIGYLFLSAWMATAVVVAVVLVLPFLWFEERPWIKAITVLAANAIEMVVELASDGVWILAAGSAIPADFEPMRALVWSSVPAYLLGRVAYIILIVLLFSALRALVRRNTETGTTRLWLYVAFLATQLSLLFVVGLITANISASLQNFYGPALVLGCICIFADALLFFSMECYGQKELEEERARLLQQQLDDYLDSCNAMVGDIEEISKIRHDLRNQMQVIAMLAERGDKKRAREQLSLMMERIEAVQVQRMDALL